MRRRQRFRDRGHADRVAAQNADGADLRRRLKLRAGHKEVDALLYLDPKLCRAALRQRAQLRRIHARRVKKARAKFVQILSAQRTGSVQLDLIGDQHEVARPVAEVHAAGGVRHDERPHTKLLQKPHRLRQLLEIIPLIAVEAA